MAQSKKVIVTLSMDGVTNDRSLELHIRDILRKGLSAKKRGYSNVEVFANVATKVEAAAMALADAVNEMASDEAHEIAVRLVERSG